MLKQLRQQVESIVGVPSSELKKYANRYESELRRSQPESSSSEHFFKASKSSDVILVGDFHGQAQSARSLLRICRRLGSEIVLILECIKSKDQKYLDLYLKGHLTETDFLKVIKWKKSWDFPWEHTKLILDWAQANNVAVYGMNLDFKKIPIKNRDQHFAKIITNLYTQLKSDADLPTMLSRKKIIAQVGDYHLAKMHLPHEINKNAKKNIKIQTVFQSPDQIYFKIIKAKKNKKENLIKISDFFKINNNRWALMTVIPWVKWQEYLLSLENIDHADDVSDHVSRFVKFMSESFGFKTDTQGLNIYLSCDLQVSKKISKLKLPLRKKIRKQIKNKQSFYIPEIEIGIVSRLTVNHLSRVAAQFILHKKNVFIKTQVANRNSFLSLIWIEMLTYLMSKLTNPKRKTDTLTDITTALNNLAFEDKGKVVLKLALQQKMKEIQYINTQQILENLPSGKITSFNYAAASSIIGGLLGEKIFYAVQKEIIKFPKDYDFLFRNVNEKSFEMAYYKAIEMIDSWPVPFKSKYDQF